VNIRCSTLGNRRDFYRANHAPRTVSSQLEMMIIRSSVISCATATIRCPKLILTRWAAKGSGSAPHC